MGLFEQFPYTNLHELNLDWCLKIAESAQEHLVGYDEDMATIAQNVIDTNDYKNAAAGYAAAAAASAADTTQAEEAEAWAKGTKNGVAVGNTAPQYHNNSKYWSDQSASSASAASGSASDAYGYAQNSADQALEAEAWAHGEKNGTPVTSDDPQYENNAYYWSQQAYVEAQAGVAPYMPYSIGNCIAYEYSNPNPIIVKASRTLTKADGTTQSINYPGCIALLSPVDFDAAGAVNTGDLQASMAGFYPIAVFASGGKEIGINVTEPNVYELVDGKKHQVLLFKMINLETATYLSDNTNIYQLTIIATNGKSSIPNSSIRNGDAGEDLS